MDIGKLGQGGVTIQARKLSILIDNLAAHDHRPPALHLRSLDHCVKHWRFAIEVWVADLLPRAPLVERVRSFGLEGRLAEIRILSTSIPDLIANREAHCDAIADAVRACAGDAVFLGGAPLAGLGTKMSEETGAIVLDGVEACVTAALRISRRAHIARH